MKTYVVDQNVMRKKRLRELIADEPDSFFIVPEASLLEMCKSQNWEGTMRPSFAHFSFVGNRAFVTLTVDKAITYELDQLIPVTVQELVNIELTSFVQSLIDELSSSGRPGASMAWISSNFTEMFARLQANELNATLAKERVTEKVELLKKGLKKEVVKALRNHQYPQYRLALIGAMAEDYVVDHLLAKKISPPDAFTFILGKPMVLRSAILSIRHVLDWMIMSGLDGALPERELNNLFDMEYALSASYFDDLITEDQGAVDAYTDLKEILEMRTEARIIIMNKTLTEIGAIP